MYFLFFSLPTSKRNTINWLSFKAVFMVLMSIFSSGVKAQSDEWQITVPQPPFNFQNIKQEVLAPLTEVSKPWKLCTLYPHLKDSYWLSVNYGMVDQAQKLGVSLKVFAADGYETAEPQIQQLKECMNWKADAILLGSINYQSLQPRIKNISQTTPVFGLVNNIHPEDITGEIGVDWYRMGYNTGEFLARKHPKDSKPATLAWFSSPQNSGGSSPSERGLVDALANSSVTIVARRYGDNAKAVKRGLVQEVLDSHPDIDYLVGGAVMSEVAVSELRLRQQQDKTKILSTYLSHGVYRGLLRGKIEMANSDQMVLQGRMSVDQAVRYLEGKSFISDLGPEIIMLTPEKLNSVVLKNSLSPANYGSVFSVSQ